MSKKFEAKKNGNSGLDLLDTFEHLVSELSQNKPDRKFIQMSCQKLGLKKYDDLTDLMQVLLEKYPEFLSSERKSPKENKATL